MCITITVKIINKINLYPISYKVSIINTLRINLIPKAKTNIAGHGKNAQYCKQVSKRGTRTKYNNTERKNRTQITC